MWLILVSLCGEFSEAALRVSRFCATKGTQKLQDPSAAGTKTRTYGRMGDAPMVGSGFYVESDIGGAAATGLGEDIMRERCSFRCVELMRGGMSPMEAAETAVRTAHDAILRHGGKPGCIALVCMNALGECGAACNYGEFTYAYAREDVEPAVAEAVPVTDQEAGTA